MDHFLLIRLFALAKMTSRCFKWLSTFCKVLLILINTVLILAGCLLIYVGLYIQQSMWLNVFKEEYSWLKSGIISSIFAFGGVIVLLSLIGFIGAVTKNKCLLTLYSIVVTIIALGFLVISISSFAFRNNALDWQRKVFPASNREVVVAGKFNQVYCYAQGLRFCWSNDIKTALQFFFSPSIVQLIVPLVSGMKNVNELCSLLNGLPLRSQIQSLCDACEMAEDYKKYEGIAEWADEQCPTTKLTSIWCARFLSKANLSNINIGVPYTKCRGVFLRLWDRWSFMISMVTLLMTATSIVLVVFAYITRSRKSSDDYYENMGNKIIDK